MKNNIAKSIMLSTDEVTNILYNKNSFSVKHNFNNEIDLNKKDLQGYEFQHIYIITDEEIKEGDWFINIGSGGHPNPGLYQANAEHIKTFKEFGPYSEIMKVIASTNKKLGLLEPWQVMKRFTITDFK